MIIGISGKKGSGKSTVAEYLHRRLPGSVRLPIAFKLKSIAMDCFGASVTQVHGNYEQKNTVTESGLTGREVLQAVGEGMRKVWPDCWVWAWENEVVGLWAQNGEANPIIVEDVRYRNEAEKIKAMGGIVIRLTRAPYRDEHESETELDRYGDFDAVIENEALGIPDTCAEVMCLCRSKGIC